MVTDNVITATRHHDISCGHRVVGHESKCASLHGHNYRVHFNCRGVLDSIGRVIDFGVIKSTLCQWLEDSWDHKFLAYEIDPVMLAVEKSFDAFSAAEVPPVGFGIVWVPFNPTAENMADYLLRIIGPVLLDTEHSGVELFGVTVEETRKCSASAFLHTGVTYART